MNQINTILNSQSNTERKFLQSTGASNTVKTGCYTKGSYNLSQQTAQYQKRAAILININHLYTDSIQRLKEDFEFQSNGNVEKFLQKNKHLIITLIDIPGKISKYFKGNPELSLEVIDLPDEQFCQLYVNIITKNKTKDDSVSFDKFIDNWLFYLSESATNNLQFSIQSSR